MIKMFNSEVEYCLSINNADLLYMILKRRQDDQ